MKKTPTLLFLKELKFFQEELKRLHEEDEERSYAPIKENMEFKYETGYSYENNRQKIKDLHDQELLIRSALAKFNAVTKVDGLDMTIAEALVKIAQLRDEIKVLTTMASRKEIFLENHYPSATVTNRITYNQIKVREDLAKAQKELANIQMAVDKTNLTALVDY